MATLRCASTLFCLLALAVMHGTCSTTPEGPPNAISLLGALEVVTEVIVSSTFIAYLEQTLF